MIETSRRGFIGGLIGFAAAAPAIVRIASIMPVKALKPVFQTSIDVQGSSFVEFSWSSFAGEFPLAPVSDSGWIFRDEIG